MALNLKNLKQTGFIILSLFQPFAIPILKSSHPCDINKNRAISNPAALAKVIESLVSEQRKSLLGSNNVLK